MTRRVLLVSHPRRPDVPDLVAEATRDLDTYGISTQQLDSDGDGPDTGLMEGVELVMVFGGDGTILRGAELVRGTGVPLLGVNLGRVGFLAEAEREDISSVVDRVAARDYTVEHRMTLEVEVRRDGLVLHRDWALNEASVEKASRQRMLELVVEVDGRPLSTWAGDGVVVATPTGSTAYAFSGGGPVVWPDVAALLVVPISAHALFARSLVLGPETHLAVEVLPRDGEHGVMWCDGRRPVDLPARARIEVRRSDSPVPLARLTASPFTDRLVAKFDLPVHGWRGRPSPDHG